MPLTRVRTLLVAAAPFLFAVGGVLYLATDMAAPAGAYVRPLLVAVALAGVSLAVFLLLTRNLDWASLLSSAFMLFTVRLVIPALIVVAIAVWWMAVGALRRVRAQPSPDASIPGQLATFAAVAGFALVAVTGWSTTAALTGPAPAFQIPEYTTSGSGGPNVYVLLLDGYPRSDTLREVFEIDNVGFLRELEDLGFVVSSSARSNYNKTWPTLASALNGTYLDRMLPAGEPPASLTEQLRWLSTLIREASLLDLMRDRGYTIRTLPSLFVSTAVTSADDYIDHGYLTEVEAKLITRSPWTMLARNEIAAFLLVNHRAAVLDSLDSTAALAEERGIEPQFVFGHILSPHTPFVLGDADVPENGPPACFPLDCSLWHPTVQDLHIEVDDFRAGLAVQIPELDRLVVETIRRIVAADPSAVIVVMSDHGIRYSLEDLPEHYRTLLAARTPDGVALFANDESPVNVFRRLAAYLGEDMDALPYERWGGTWDTFLDLELLEGE